MTDLHISHTWQDRWVVARKPWVESEADGSVVANFADHEHAENWLARYQKWRKMLHHTT